LTFTSAIYQSLCALFLLVQYYVTATLGQMASKSVGCTIVTNWQTTDGRETDSPRYVKMCNNSGLIIMFAVVVVFVAVVVAITIECH